jgi:uncharacterized protein GlcG (DUF336 family)
MRRLRDMSRALAAQLVEAAEARAATIGIAIAVVVVDRGGHSVLAARMDGAALCAVPLAANKAETAVMTLAPTEAWFGSTQPGKPDWGFSTALAGRFTCMPGGLPVTVAGEVIGAVGVSGGEATQDVSCAEAALAALAALGER